MTRPDVVISIHVNLQLHHELDPSRCLREQKCLMVDHPGIYVSGSKVCTSLGRRRRAPPAWTRPSPCRAQIRAHGVPDPRGLVWRLTASPYGPRSPAASSQNASSAGRGACCCWPWRGAAATPTGVAPDSGAGRCSVWCRG